MILTTASRVAAFAVCSSLLSAACEFESALDVVGVGETVIETRETERFSPDPPVFDPELSIVEEFDGCRMRVNKSASITHLTLKDFGRDDRDRFENVLFPTRSEALAALGSRKVVPSMEVVNGALKPWNDGLYAAIERIAENGGAGSLVNKRATFDAVLATLLERSAAGDGFAGDAAAHFRAAQLLAPGSAARAAVSPEIEAEAARAVERFRADVFSSTPIGFYSWTDELEAIFRRDRFLQTALPPGPAGLPPAAAVARAMATDPELDAGYRRVLDLYRGLTNPMRDLDPTAVPTDAGAAFVREHPELNISWLPASDSPEVKLLRALYSSGHPPANLLDALIAAIQSGEIDLTPSATSGFYDWQLYALETLLLPERSSEGRHLSLSQKYREKLVETFKSLVIQTRETHVKQLGTITVPTSAMSSKPREIDVYPLLPIEPFPTFYLRTARAYAFLHNLLRATLGQAALDETARVLEDGTSASAPLSEELEHKTQLLYGLHLVAAASIGMRDELTPDERAHWERVAAEQAARSWIARWSQDPDVARDPRVAVPMVRDAQSELTRNLAVVGVRVIQLAASYPRGREPQVSQDHADHSRSFETCVVRGFVPFEPYMLVEQTLEFRRSSRRPPLTRQALRTALDGHDNLAAMQRALEAAP